MDISVFFWRNGSGVTFNERISTPLILNSCVLNLRKLKFAYEKLPICDFGRHQRWYFFKNG